MSYSSVLTNLSVGDIFVMGKVKSRVYRVVGYQRQANGTYIYTYKKFDLKKKTTFGTTYKTSYRVMVSVIS